MKSLAVLVALLLRTLTCAEESCRFYYTKQPVQELFCYPGNQSVELMCEVQAPKDAIFQVRWQVQDVNGTRQEDADSYLEQGDLKIARTMLVLHNVAMISKVFCEVHVDGHTQYFASDVLNFANASRLPPCNSYNISLVNEMSDCIDVPPPVATPSVPPVNLSQQVLYGVAAVVVVFGILIVVLSVAIVLMLRRKWTKKPTKSNSRQGCEDEDPVPSHTGFTNRLNLEKSLTVTFSGSPDGSGVSAIPPILSAHAHKTCPSVPCPPTPDETTKLDIAEPASHLLDIYHLQDGGQEVGEASSEQDEEGVEKATPPSVTWASPLHAGVCNPGYVSTLQQPPTTQECDVAGLDIADSAYVRSRYEWNEPVVDEDVGKEEVGGDKYRGNYERDPVYMARQRHTYTNCSPSTYENSAPLVSPATVGERSDKYRGNYERSDTYVFPPATSSATALSGAPVSEQDVSRTPQSQRSEQLDGVIQAGIGAGKYRGNYERSQVYVQHLLKTEMTSPSNHNPHTEHVQLMHSNSS